MDKEPKEPRELQATEIVVNYLNLIGQSKSRLKKGYYFEKLIVEILKNLNVEFKSNPVESFSLWLFNTSTTHDLEVFNQKIEIKYNSPNAKLYKSYIRRDWIPRASLIITNDDSPIWHNKKLLKYLKRNGKKVLPLSKFIIWVKRKIRSSITSHVLNNDLNNGNLNRNRVVVRVVQRVVMSSKLFLKAGFSPPLKAFCSKFSNLISGLSSSLHRMFKAIGGMSMSLKEMFQRAWKEYRSLKLREAEEKHGELIDLWKRELENKTIQLRLGETKEQKLKERELRLKEIKARVHALSKVINWRRTQMWIMGNKLRLRD